ncbi:MAG: hypothetical protein CSA84_00055 [Actinomycetales bacterium]|nr:MAG: hypothetical protein CSA84_00055 [Actinomycetales bacterium]
MRSQARVFVAGATGTAGSAIAARLRRDGHTVIASTSTAEAAPTLQRMGYTPVVLDLADRRDVRQAVEDHAPDIVVNAARGRTNATTQEPRFADALAEAADAVGIDGMVYVSVFRADARTGVPHFDVKAQIEGSLSGRTFPVAVLRPTTFMNLLLSPMVTGSVRDHGVFASPQGPDSAIAYIHADEVAAVAGHLIAADRLEAGVFAFGGPEPLTTREIADRYGQVLGQPIDVQQIPLEAIRQSAGEDLAAMAAYLNTHDFIVSEPTFPAGYVPEPITFDEARIQAALK